MQNNKTLSNKHGETVTVQFLLNVMKMLKIYLQCEKMCWPKLFIMKFKSSESLGKEIGMY